MFATFKNNKKLQLFSVLGLIVLALYWGYASWNQANPQLTLEGLVQAKEVQNASRFGGRVKKVWVKEGDWVEAGDKLISFDDLELRSKLSEAKSTLIQAKAQLSLLESGADPQDLKQAQAQVNQAQQNLSILVNGATPDEMAHLQAKLTEATGRLASAESAYQNGEALLTEGIISEQKYQDLKNQLEAAKAFHQAAKTQMMQNQRGGARPEQLKIAKAQLQGVQAQYKKLAKGAHKEEFEIAKANVMKAESAFHALEGQLSEAQLTAPIAGVVTIMNVNPSELVTPTKPIVSIINYKTLWADIYVPERGLEKVKTGQPVEIHSSVYPGKVFEGRVAFISPKSEFIPGSGSASSPDEQSSFRVKVDINHLDKTGQTQLHPGMKIQVRF